MKFGRLAPHPAETHPRLMAGAFVRFAALPPVPAVVDYISHVTDWPMYLNQEIGDCTCAAAGHIIEAATAYGQGSTVEITDQDVLAAYEAVSGYNPADPSTDRGAVMQDILDYWRKHGIGGHRILAFAQLDHTDLNQIDQALYLFGHVYVGCVITQDAMDRFNGGQQWTAAPNSPALGGHAVDLGYRSGGTRQVITWGRPQAFDESWWRSAVEEAWVVVTPEWISVNGDAPEGLDVAALNTAFTELTGQAGPFPVAPQPQPGPTPTPVPPGPTPGPVPVADPHDLALIDSLSRIGPHGWLAERHVGDNRRASAAVEVWARAKGYLP